MSDIKGLIDKAKKADDSADALRFSQAALNIANAQRVEADTAALPKRVTET